MAREISPEVAEYMAQGLSYDAARMKVNRTRGRAQAEQTERQTEQIVPKPNKPNTDNVRSTAQTEQTEHGTEETEQVPNDPTRGVANLPYPYFRRKVLEETAEEYNERWESYTREHGHDPVGRKEGWEPSYQDEMRARKEKAGVP